MTFTEQSQYYVERVDLTADRLGERVFDIKGSVVEINLYETIEKPYLTGQLAVVDNIGWRDVIQIKGTERISLAIKAHKDAPLIERRFLVTEILSDVSVNDRSDVRVLNLIEEQGYLNTLRKISQAYTAKPHDIIRAIAFDHLGLFVNITDRPSLGETVRVIVPYLTPLDAMDWILKGRAVSPSPYFCFAAIRNPRRELTLASLERLLQGRAWNETTPYTYARNSSNINLPDNEGAPYERPRLFNVLSYKAGKIEATLRLAQSGAIGSTYETHDVTSNSRVLAIHHSGRDTLNTFMRAIRQPSASIAMGDDLAINAPDKPPINIASHPSRVYSHLVSSRQYYDESLTPVAGFHDELRESNRHSLKIKSASLRKILMNNMFTIAVPGQPYLLSSGAGCGGMLRMNYVKPDGIDSNRSGTFLIYAAKHVFSQNRHTASLAIVKLDKETS